MVKILVIMIAYFGFLIEFEAGSSRTDDRILLLSWTGVLVSLVLSTCARDSVGCHLSAYCSPGELHVISRSKLSYTLCIILDYMATLHSVVRIEHE